MTNREYPKLPMVGVGGVVISGNKALLVCRATDPARGEWTIPGGLLEVGETLVEGVARELLEETGLTVRVLELIEALERIFYEKTEDGAAGQAPPNNRNPSDAAPHIAGPRYHYVILDYLCEGTGGEPRITDEISDFAYVSEQDLGRYALNEATTRVLRKAFALASNRAALR